MVAGGWWDGPVGTAGSGVGFLRLFPSPRSPALEGKWVPNPVNQFLLPDFLFSPSGVLG